MGETGEVPITIDKPILEIDAIDEPRNRIFQSRGEIEKYVEAPLVPSCEHFWDLNIKTLSTSANTKDINENGYIILDYDSLSDENKLIAEKHADILDYDEVKAVKFNIPISKNTTLEDVKEVANKFARNFKKQKPTWIPTFTLDQLNKIYYAESNEFTVEDFKKEGWFYDDESQKFYMSKEHCEKFKLNFS